MTDGLATVRWIDGRRARVVIAGGGVAGLETLLALRALAGDRIDITLVTPELRFVNRSMVVAQPFSPQRVRGVRLEHVAAAHGADWHRGALDRVERQRRVVVTKAGHELAYGRARAFAMRRGSPVGPRSAPSSSRATHRPAGCRKRSR